jgi:hypothetical protein
MVAEIGEGVGGPGVGVGDTGGSEPPQLPNIKHIMIGVVANAMRRRLSTPPSEHLIDSPSLSMAGPPPVELDFGRFH